MNLNSSFSNCLVVTIAVTAVTACAPTEKISQAEFERRMQAAIKKESVTKEGITMRYPDGTVRQIQADRVTTLQGPLHAEEVSALKNKKASQ